MKNQTSLLRLACILVLALAVAALAGPQSPAHAATKVAMKERRADVVTIDAMAADGDLSLPAVTFLHDQHTAALAKANKDCSSCHKPLKDGESGSYAFRFLDAANVKGEPMRAMFHQNCIGCHEKMRKTLPKTGPLEAECRSCHIPKPTAESNRQDIGLDKRMHFNHLSSKQITFDDQETNCGACHHVYDSTTRKLTWGKNKEDSCRACHLLPDAQRVALDKDPSASDDSGLLNVRPTLDVAAHQACVNCHLRFELMKAKDEQIKTGPTTCDGCHSPVAIAAFAEALVKTPIDAVPRLQRGQADVALMLPTSDKVKEFKGMMRPVSFNHKYHEAMNADCRTCHHKKIAACGTCHTVEGKAATGFANLGRVMHKSDSLRSCVGCHFAQTQKQDCAGCHNIVPTHPGAASCASCHTTPPGVTDADAQNGSLLGKSDEQKLALATAAVAQRSYTPKLVAENDIPEKVTIGLLSREFEPSEMPHRKIVLALWEKQKQNRLATTFHSTETTLCQDCHNNSPASKTPPKCVSCHSIDVKSSPSGQLSLKAAYHQQCMTCHTRMNQKPAETQCVDCHKKARGN